VQITEAMKMAASRALAEVAREPFPPAIRKYLAKAYPADAAIGMFEESACPLKQTYVIPKPFDPRVVPRVARFVAAAAIGEGIAKKPIADLAAYEQALTRRLRRKR
jgi:malate dehydrogenase (oxaloacetate-decarboxylating)(NADP+)